MKTVPLPHSGLAHEVDAVMKVQRRGSFHEKYFPRHLTLMLVDEKLFETVKICPQACGANAAWRANKRQLLFTRLSLPNEQFIRQEKNAQGNFSSIHQREGLNEGVFKRFYCQ